MIQKAGFLSVVKKEYFGFINSPLAYLIIIPFLLISHFLFLRTALVVGDANLRPFIDLLPWFLVVLAPALTMKSFSDEYNKGTIELLFSHPLTEWTLLVAKYVGLLMFYITLLITTLILPVVLLVFAQPDLGLMLSQYLGAFFLGAMFISLGLMVSTYIRSLIGSFLIGVALCFSLLLVGMNFVVLGVPAPFNRIFVELGVISHLNNFGRGVVDFRDVLYFATIIGVALTASVMKLSQRRLAESAGEKRKLWVILGLVIGIGISLNVLMNAYPVRLDLTANQRYSMSSGTQQLLAELPDRVTVTLYMSENLPGPMQLTLKEVSDRLQDFSKYGGAKLVTTTKIIDTSDPAAKAEAVGEGIQDITFNQIGAGSFEAQSGMLGIVVRYGDETEVIPFVQDASNLEYQLARLILKMTRDELPKIGLYDATSMSQLTTLRQLLENQYELETLSFEEDSSLSADLKAVLVVDDGSSGQATASAVLSNYLQNNGNVLLMIDGVNINEQVMLPTPSSSELLGLLSDYGIQINSNLAYDLQSHENVTMPAGPNSPIQYIVPYPFWVRSSVVEEHAPWSGAELGSVLLGWPSSQTLTGEAQELLVTTAAGGVQENNFVIQPDQLQTLRSAGEVFTLGALIANDNQRIASIGDAHFVMDGFLDNAPENQAFISNLVDWTAADDILSSIPQRTSGRIPFSFSDVRQLQIIQWGSLIVPAVGFGLFGIYWLSRRKRRTKRDYSGV